MCIVIGFPKEYKPSEEPVDLNQLDNVVFLPNGYLKMLDTSKSKPLEEDEDSDCGAMGF